MGSAKHVSIMVLIIVSACDNRSTTLSDAERTTIAASVDSAMVSFQVAERALDAERVIAHMAPDFYMYSDSPH